MRNLLIISLIPLLFACSKDVTVSFRSAQQTVLESSNEATVVVSLTRNNQIGPIDSFTSNNTNNREVRISYEVSGDAIFGTHHKLRNGVIVFPPGEKNYEIAVPLLHHKVFEDNKKLTMKLLAAEGVQLGEVLEHSIEIQDVDRLPQANFTSNYLQVSESVGTISVGISLEYPAITPVSIPMIFSGTAIEGVNFTAPGLIYIPVGEQSANYVITLIDDIDVNPDRTLEISFGEFTGVTAGTNTLVRFSIVDNDDLPTVYFTSGGQTLPESTGLGSVNIALSKTYALDVTIPVIVSGTAQNPDDHDLTLQSVVIPSGSIEGSIPFSVINDSLDEDDETIILTIGNPVNANLGVPSTQINTIQDDDPLPTIQFQALSQSVSEAAGNVKIVVLLSNMSGRAITVPYTVSGTALTPSDHSLSSGNLVVPSGSVSSEISFAVVNDNAFENNETVIVTLGSPVNASLGSKSVHTVTIQNNDVAPVVEVVTEDQGANEGSGGTILSHTFTISLSGNTEVSTSIPFSFSGTATEGSDFELSTASPLVIPPGQTSATIILTILGDEMYEISESAILNLGSPSGASLGADTSSSLTILNDDPIPSLNFEAALKTVSEGAGTVFAIVTLTNPTYKIVVAPFTISGTANYPQDHNLQSGSFSIPSGQTFGILDFSLVDDSEQEGLETTILTLGTISNATLGATSSLTFNITDNDRLFDLSKVSLWLDAMWGIDRDSSGLVKRWIPRKGAPAFNQKLSNPFHRHLISNQNLAVVEKLNASDWSAILGNSVDNEQETLFWVGETAESSSNIYFEELQKFDLEKDLSFEKNRSISELISADCHSDPDACVEVRRYLYNKYSQIR